MRPRSVLEGRAPRGVDVAAYLPASCKFSEAGHYHFLVNLFFFILNEIFTMCLSLHEGPHCCLAEQAFYLSTSSEKATSGVQWELLPHPEPLTASCVKARQCL